MNNSPRSASEEYCRKRNRRPDFKVETLKVARKVAINPIVGHIRSKEFTRSHAKHFEIERARQVSGATVSRGLAVLSNLLTFALDKGLIDAHPMVRYGRIPEGRKALRVMSLEEERKLVAAVLERDLTVGVYCGLLGETAMRPEEGLRVQWPFIDMARPMLTVDKSRTAEGEGRHIPLSDFAVELLGKIPRVVGCPFVIVRLETLKPVKDCRDVFRKAKEAVGLDWVTFRGFRHFRASQWVSRSVDLETVQQLMGRADIHTKMRDAHLAPTHATRSIIESQRAEVAELNSATSKVETSGRH